jgi:predicted SprT family Zn-dependent metalloprotease
MDEKLTKLYNGCIKELKSIGINMEDSKKIGEITISLAKRKAKRYGCCKQLEPLSTYYHIEYRNHRRIKIYDVFMKHNIEISKWVLELNDDIIKNTIMHELIHCLPYCNNHGKEFKKYAELINEKLGYEIQRLGNKEKDYEKSNIVFDKSDEVEYKYKIRCKKCGIVFYRQRLKKNFIRDYRCGACKGKLELI